MPRDTESDSTNSSVSRNTDPSLDDSPANAEPNSVIGHLRKAVAQATPTNANTLAIPQIPHHEIEEEIARGGMGVVYKAKHTLLNRVVALKTILAGDNATRGEVIRFLAEPEAIAAVRHPNVVQVFEVGSANSRPYYAMEFIEGGTLAKWLAANGPLPPRHAAEVIEATARGTQAVHDRSIIHRDIKPGNILLEAKPRDNEPQPNANTFAFIPKLSDFGLAKRLAATMTQSQAAIGTPAYMAPEQGGEAKYVGPEADVYSLGAVLYECLTGKPPFDGESAWAVIPRVLNDAPPPIRDKLPTVPRDLELICLKCLEKKPEHRYRTATELADDLARFLQGKPVSVRPVNAPTRAYRWTKRNPAFAGLVALTLFLLFVIPPLFVWNQARLDRRETAAAEATARADAAKREREQAELAAQEAKNAQAAALKLADARELFGIQNKLRTLATDRNLSWTFASRAELSRAMTLIENDPSATYELRSAAVRVFLSDDLKPLEPALRGFTASAIATNPVTGEIACGESIAWVFTQCRVRIFDPRDKKSKRELSFPAGFVRQPTGDVRGSPDAVRTLAFSPDGKQLYVGTRSSMVHRFDLENKAAKPATSWAASRNPVEQLAVTNTTVYGLCRPETPVFAWECETGKLLAKLESPENTPISAISLLPTGELLTCDSKHIHRWTPTFKVAHSVPNPGARRIACTATTAIIAGDGTHLDLYNSETMTQSDRFLDPALRHDSHEESLRSLAVHPSGAFIASSSGDHDRSVKVWEFASGRLVGIVHVAGTGPIAITWSSDGAVLLATASEHIARWSFHPAESQQFTCLTGNTIVASHFCHEGKQVALTDSVQGKRTALLGMPNTVSRTAPLPEPGGNGLPGFAIHPATGLIAITEGAPGIALWNGKKNISKQGFTSEIAWAPRFSYNGNSLWVVINSSHLHVYDTKTKALRHKWNGSLAGSVSGLASLDALAIGKEWAVTGGRGGSIYQLDTATCELKNTFAAPGDPVTALAITPDDELIVAGTQKGKVRFVKTTTREELPPLAGHTGGTTAVAVSHNGALLATGGRDRKVRLWKRREHQFEPLFTLNDLPEHVRELHFCPQSNQLLVLLINEHAVRVWNLDKLQSQLNEFRLGW